MDATERRLRLQALKSAAVQLAWCSKADYKGNEFILIERALEFGSRCKKPVHHPGCTCVECYPQRDPLGKQEAK